MEAGRATRRLPFSPRRSREEQPPMLSGSAVSWSGEGGEHGLGSGRLEGASVVSRHTNACSTRMLHTTLQRAAL